MVRAKLESIIDFCNFQRRRKARIDTTIHSVDDGWGVEYEAEDVGSLVSRTATHAASHASRTARDAGTASVQFDIIFIIVIDIIE